MTASSARWVALSTGAEVGSKLLVFLLLARVLSPDQFGLFAACWALWSAVLGVVQAGVGQAFVQSEAISDDDISRSRGAVLGFAVLGAGGLAALATSIETGLRLPGLAALVIASSPLLVIAVDSGTREAFLQRSLSFRPLALADSLGALWLIAVSYAFGVAGFGSVSLLAGQWARALIRYAVVVVSTRHLPAPAMTLRMPVPVRSYGFSFTLGRLLNELALYVDRLLVGRILGADALGFYERAYQMMLAQAVLVGQTIERFLFPRLSHDRRLASGGVDMISSTVSRLSIVMLPTTVVIAFTAPLVVRLLLGPSWNGMTGALMVLLSGAYFRTTYKVFDSAIKAHGAAALWRRAGVQAVYAAAVAIGTYVGAGNGIEGVAVGVLSATVLHFFLMLGLCCRLLSIRIREALEWQSAGALIAVATGAIGLMSRFWIGAISPMPTELQDALLALLAALLGWGCLIFRRGRH